MTSLVILVLFCILFVASARALVRRDGVFFAFYVVLFVYTFFTQVAWIAYPDAFQTLIPGSVVLSDSTYRGYQLFVAASFAGVFFMLWRGTHRQASLRTHGAPNDPRRFAFFVLLVLLYDAVLLGTLLYNYETLSYENPDALKSQTLFARPFVLFPVVFLALYATAVRVKAETFNRRMCQFLMVLTAGIFLVIAVRAGTRTALATTIIGLVCFEALSLGTVRRLFSPRVIIGTLSAFFVLTAVATYRVQVDGPLAFGSLSGQLLFDPGWFFSNRLSLQAIVFGDYAGPSVLLLRSIQDRIMFPVEAVPALVLGCLPFGAFSGAPSIGFMLSRIVDTAYDRPWQGFGYYILIEGYNVMGWLGILYNTVVVGGAMRLCRRLWHTPDRFYRAFVGALFGMQALSIVRGQSSEIIRAWYLVILPGLVLLWLGCGLRAEWSRRSRAPRVDRQAPPLRSFRRRLHTRALATTKPVFPGRGVLRTSQIRGDE